MLTLLLDCELLGLLLDTSHLDSTELISDLNTYSVTLDRYCHETAKGRRIKVRTYCRVWVRLGEEKFAKKQLLAV
jgi:hypothetical protein